MRNTKRILIAHVIYKLDFGGLENGLINLINNMPSERYKHVIICLTDYTDFSKKLKKEVQLFSLHKNEGKDIGLYFKIYKLFRKIKPDIVHTRNMATLESLFPAFLAGVKCRVHGEHGRDVHDLDGKSVKFRLLRKLFRPFVDRYMPLSDELERYLLENINVPAEKITHICNGVDLDRFYPSENNKDVLPESFSDADSIVIGTVGRMEEVKDQENLATAFISIVTGDPEMKKKLRLVMIGSGSLLNTIKMKLDKEDCTGVSWLPGTREDTPELLRELDIFVLPSRAEGISNTILEAMAIGLPVVATNVGGNSELVVDGETGFLVPRNNPQALAEAIVRYINNPELRGQHAKNARERAVKEFSMDIMVKKYIDVYDDVIKVKGCRAVH
jgi:sugar transferase (PEP-CTERM/EpsH1 system associated)